MGSLQTVRSMRFRDTGRGGDGGRGLFILYISALFEVFDNYYLLFIITNLQQHGVHCKGDMCMRVCARVCVMR